ncbi:hypothetical protein BJ166DRAFT_533642 [Pestalotiopsis sp. NC0098]|nr:hypothetical protein BJ166DRAFT_533642 [Pestalotiopsis sp. NC0098]
MDAMSITRIIFCVFCTFTHLDSALQCDFTIVSRRNSRIANHFSDFPGHVCHIEAKSKKRAIWRASLNRSSMSDSGTTLMNILSLSQYSCFFCCSGARHQTWQYWHERSVITWFLLACTRPQAKRPVEGDLEVPERRGGIFLAQVRTDPQPLF